MGAPGLSPDHTPPDFSARTGRPSGYYPGPSPLMSHSGIRPVPSHRLRWVAMANPKLQLKYNKREQAAICLVTTLVFLCLYARERSSPASVLLEYTFLSIALLPLLLIPLLPKSRCPECRKPLAVSSGFGQSNRGTTGKCYHCNLTFDMCLFPRSDPDP